MHPTLEEREVTREGMLTRTLGQGTYPWVRPAGAVAKEGVRAERRVECKGTCRMVTTAVATSSGAVTSAKGTIPSADGWEEDT